MSRELIAGAGFGAEDFPAARRAVKFDPPNEEALVRLCATGVRDGTALQAALEACGKVASMTNNSFHAGVVAEAFEEAHRPCDGLPVLKKTMGDEATNNVSPIFSVGRLEAECGEMEHAESHLRAVVRLRLEDLRTFNWEDRPPSADENQNTYEGSERLSLSEARRNLSALLTLRHKDTEAFQVCRSALGSELKRCTCRFLPREGVDCDVSAAE
jgi:rhodanese-related sulfurtransferase